MWCPGSIIYRYQWREFIYNFVILDYAKYSDRAGYMSPALAISSIRFPTQITSTIP
jgi:hypothetical protein